MTIKEKLEVISSYKYKRVGRCQPNKFYTIDSQFRLSVPLSPRRYSNFRKAGAGPASRLRIQRFIERESILDR